MKRLAIGALLVMTFLAEAMDHHNNQRETLTDSCIETALFWCCPRSYTLRDFILEDMLTQNTILQEIIEIQNRTNNTVGILADNQQMMLQTFPNALDNMVAYQRRTFILQRKIVQEIHQHRTVIELMNYQHNQTVEELEALKEKIQFIEQNAITSETIRR